METNRAQVGTCTDEGCLLAETGKCSLNKALKECEFYVEFAVSELDAKQLTMATTTSQIREKHISNIEKDDDDDDDERAKSFYSGRELGRLDALPISHAKYTKLIALFGKSEAGKTTFLISLYLQALHLLLPENYLFAGSYTLQAFEQRLRHLRSWKGDPESMFPVDHTRVSDPRQPALLHLSIMRDDIKHELLLTDYPGEWTERVGEVASFSNKLSFLKQAHGIVLILDGLQFSCDTERHAEAEVARMLLDRLVKDIQIPASAAPLAILIAKSDHIGMEIPPSATEVADHAKQLGFPTAVIPLASFSKNTDQVKHGTGIIEAIEHLLQDVSPVKNSEPKLIVKSQRAFHRFRT